MVRLQIAAGIRRSALVRCPSGVFVVLVLCLAACSTATDPRATLDPRLSIGVPEGNADGTEAGVRQLARNITAEALTQISTEGRALPRLAESWNWEGENRLRIRLRDGVTLHDGRRFDAQMAAEQLAVAIATGANRESYPGLGDVGSAIPDGNLELTLNLAKASPQLPVDLTVLLDIHAGPFRVVNQTNEVIELDRFDRYYQGVPAISHVTIRSFDALRTSYASLLRGELDMVYDVPVDAVEFVRNEDVEVVSVPRWYQHHLTFNTHDRRFKSNLVRKALNLAVDRASIIDKVLHGAGSPSNGPIYPGFWSFDSNAPVYPFDPEQAAALLESAGYPLRQTPQGPPARLRFTCLLPKDFAVWERIALEVQRDLFNVGVDMQFKVVPLNEFNELVFSGRFEAAFINMFSGPTPSRSYIWWRSTRTFKGFYNVFGYENAQAEALVEVLRRSTKEAAIRAATSKLQRVLYDDPPAVFIAWDTRTRAIHRRFVLPEDERDPVWALWKWTLASPSESAVNK